MWGEAEQEEPCFHLSPAPLFHLSTVLSSVPITSIIHPIWQPSSHLNAPPLPISSTTVHGIVPLFHPIPCARYTSENRSRSNKRICKLSNNSVCIKIVRENFTIEIIYKENLKTIVVKTCWSSDIKVEGVLGTRLPRQQSPMKQHFWCCPIGLSCDVLPDKPAGTSKWHIRHEHQVFPHVPTPDGLKETTGDANITFRSVAPLPRPFRPGFMWRSKAETNRKVAVSKTTIRGGTEGWRHQRVTARATYSTCFRGFIVE